ncbi:MAG: phage protease [Bacilli bacterium]
MKMPYEIFDGMVFTAEDPRGKYGELRTSWRLLKVGENRLKKSGLDFVVTLSSEDVSAAVKYHREKGEKIPLDSRHALFLAAEAAGVSETAVLRMIPQGIAAMGFGDLAEKDGDLWIENVEWLPLAAELYRRGQLRYFSPVVRGLDGKSPLRITSVALDNVPALCDLDVLAASGEEPGQKKTNKKQEDMMKKLEAALRNLLGDDSLALAAETESVAAEKVEALAKTLPELRQKAGKVEAMAAEIATLKPLAERAEALELAAETGKKTSLIDAALADGRVCNAQKEVLQKMGSVALAEFLEAIPKNKAVPTDALPKGVSGGVVSLSAEEVRIAKSMGIDETAMLEEKKRQLSEGGKA